VKLSIDLHVLSKLKTGGKSLHLLSVIFFLRGA